MQQRKRAHHDIAWNPIASFFLPLDAGSNALQCVALRHECSSVRVCFDDRRGQEDAQTEETKRTQKAWSVAKSQSDIVEKRVSYRYTRSNKAELKHRGPRRRSRARKRRRSRALTSRKEKLQT